MEVKNGDSCIPITCKQGQIRPNLILVVFICLVCVREYEKEQNPPYWRENLITIHRSFEALKCQLCRIIITRVAVGRSSLYCAFGALRTVHRLRLIGSPGAARPSRKICDVKRVIGSSRAGYPRQPDRQSIAVQCELVPVVRYFV